MNTRPNILLITADQWRGDCLGIAGHPQVKTPHLDALAQEGIRFARHYATTAPCSPARASLYTGLYQMNHRVLRNGTPLDNRFDNVARAGRRAGYLPTLFGYTDTSPDPREHHPNDPVLTTYEGILPGFLPGQLLLEDDKTWLSWLRAKGFSETDLQNIHMVEQEEGERISLAATRYSADETPTAFLTESFLSWLKEQEDETPWFTHVSFLRPHPPICVPAPYNRMYDADAGPEFHGADTPDGEKVLHPLIEALQPLQSLSHHIPGAAGHVRDLDHRDLARLRALYYGMITEVDAQLGRLIEGLRTSGAYDNTLIIFTSDHAEMMGDHWMLGKGGFYEESYHVPLIIRAPETIAPRPTQGGYIVEDFTSAVDLFPTLLDLLDVSPLHSPDGESLLPFLKGEMRDDWRKHALWEFSFRQIEIDGMESPATGKSLLSMKTDDWQYVTFPDLPDLFLTAAEDGGRMQIQPPESIPMESRLTCLERLLAARMVQSDETLCKGTVWTYHPDR